MGSSGLAGGALMKCKAGLCAAEVKLNSIAAPVRQSLPFETATKKTIRSVACEESSNTLEVRTLRLPHTPAAQFVPYQGLSNIANDVSPANRSTMLAHHCALPPTWGRTLRSSGQPPAGSVCVFFADL